MGIRIERHTYRLGDSRAVTLPLAWCKFYGERAERVTIIGSSVLLVAPLGLEAEAERLAKQLETIDHAK